MALPRGRVSDRRSLKSRVFTLDSFAATFAGVWSHAYNFWYFLDGTPRKQFGTPFRRDVDVEDYYRQKMTLFNDWFIAPEGISAVFFQKWDFWSFGSGKQQQAYAEDWIPPFEWIYQRKEAGALRQEPSVRKVIHCDGMKRTIRVNLERF